MSASISKCLIFCSPVHCPTTSSIESAASNFASIIPVVDVEETWHYWLCVVEEFINRWQVGDTVQVRLLKYSLKFLRCRTLDCYTFHWVLTLLWRFKKNLQICWCIYLCQNVVVYSWEEFGTALGHTLIGLIKSVLLVLALRRVQKIHWPS